MFIIGERYDLRRNKKVEVVSIRISIRKVQMFQIMENPLFCALQGFGKRRLFSCGGNETKKASEF